MTDNGVSREQGSRNLPGYRGRLHEGDGGLDARHPAATFQGGNLAFGASEPAELVDYSAVLRKLWRRKFLLVAIAVLGVAGAAAIIVRLPVHYVAHAFVVIGDPFAKNQGSGAATLQDTGAIQTEVAILKSPQLAIEVIRDLKLQHDPEFNPAASAEQPAAFPAALLQVKEWLLGAKAASDPQAAAAVELSQTIDNFLDRLRVSIKESSRMVDVAFESSNPGLAMKIANAMVDRYV